jgi:hypothetical protein
MFKFAMNAAVMLATSAAAFATHQRNEERDFTDGKEHGVSYKLLEPVQPIEAGIVVGRLEYAYAENSYLVRYRGGDGRQVENFITESALIDDPRATAKDEEPRASQNYEAGAKVADLKPAEPTATIEGKTIRVYYNWRDAAGREVSQDITIPIS